MGWLQTDLALVNGRIITMDDEQPDAEAALVRNGRIVLVGTTSEVLDASDGAEVLDVGGRTVVPGFVDGHAHFEMTCCALTHSLSVTTPPHNSLREIAATIREYVRTVPAGEWVLVRCSFNLYARLEEKRLFTRQELDAITERHPMMVMSSLHVSMLNTRALRELNLLDGAPPMGATVHRDESGSPTGVITEVWDMVPPYTVEQVKRAIREKGRELFSAHGITTILNLPCSAEDIRAVQELQASEELPIRFRFYPHIPRQTSLDAIISTGIQPGFGSDMMRFGGVKIFVDGAGHDGYGNRLCDLKWTPDELTEFVCKAHMNGQQLWMHICSRQALLLACDAIEAALKRHPGAHRHRIEHSADYLIEDEDIDRVAALGLLTVTTPTFIHAQGDVLLLPNSNRWPRRYRLRSLVERGFRVIGSSDSTGSIPSGIPPLFNIACAVTRRTLSGNRYVHEEALDIIDALRLFTIWPAIGGFEEQHKGSITPGKLGDFAVLSADPREVAARDPDGLFDLRSEATIVGGQLVWGS